MKTIHILCTLALGALMLSSCGSSKKAAADNYYYNPKKFGTTAQPTEKFIATKEVERLSAEKTENLRALGIGNDYDIKYARSEALRNGQAELARLLQSAIVEIAQEYHKKVDVTNKKFNETKIQDYVENIVAQKISSRIVGIPESYELSDGTVRVYMCVELAKPTDSVLKDIYGQMTKDEIINTDYDEQEFIERNKEVLQDRREKTLGM